MWRALLCSIFNNQSRNFTDEIMLDKLFYFLALSESLIYGNYIRHFNALGSFIFTGAAAQSVWRQLSRLCGDCRAVCVETVEQSVWRQSSSLCGDRRAVCVETIEQSGWRLWSSLWGDRRAACEETVDPIDELAQKLTALLGTSAFQLMTGAFSLPII